MESAENQAQPQSNQESEAESNSTLSKTETIALLNESIDRLEETIEKISKDSGNISPSKSIDKSINTLLTTTQELENAVSSTEAKVSQESAPNPATIIDRSQAEVSKPQRSKNEQQKAVDAVTKPKTQPKKNIVLIVIGITAIATAIVAVFWLWKPQQLANLLPSAKPISAPTEVVVEPQYNVAVERSLETSPENLIDNTPENLGIVSDISTMDFPPEIEPVAEPIEDVVETVIPDELTSGRPKKLKMVTIEPKLNFTPEQNLIAALETKVSELVETYDREFIQEVQIDLPASSLLVRLTDDWYNLDRAGQNSLGNEILERARAFRFQKLELQDNLGTLVARNPIVGENIIILQNSRQQD